MDAYEDRQAKFLEENKEKLEKLKKIESKMKKIDPIREELKSSIQQSLEEYNLQGFSDDQVTISRRNGNLRWDFKKDLTKEQKDEIRTDLIDEYPDYFEYRKTSDSWSWRFTFEGQNSCINRVQWS